MSGKKDSTYVMIVLSCDQEALGLSEKAAKTLSKTLKTPREDLERLIVEKGIRLPRVRVSEKLLKLIKEIKKSNVSVKVKALKNRTGNDKIAPPDNDDMTIRGVDETTEAWARTDWKKGDVIEGLYKVVGEDAGGMGKVYFVFHRTWRMMLAIKTPLPQAVKSPSHLARFMREAELWVDLGVHPNIATCYYARVINGLPRLFIEYVDGGTLEDWMNEKRIVDYAKASDVMLQFCYGMMHAENRGMIHRDIKPANCLMTKDGALKITDFGLVKRLEESVPRIENGQGPEIESPRDIESDVTVAEGGVRGSPWWMAPERFTKKYPVDIRSDIYSFGVMLYRLTVGVMPFSYRDGKDLKSLILAHAQKAPRDALSIKPDLPKPVLDVMMKCLSKNPSHRPGSFSELAEEMESVVSALNGAHITKRPGALELRTDSLNNQAVSLLDFGRYDEAIKLFEDAQSANPDHLESVYNLHALRWKQAETSDQDLVSLMNSLKIEVRDTPAFSHLMGLVYLQRGDSIRALEFLNSAFESGPEYRAWWIEQGKDPENYIRSLGYALIGLKGKFGGHIKAVRRIGFGPIGDRVFSVGEDRSIRIWDFSTGRCQKNLRTFAFVPQSGAFSVDGRLGATCYGDTYRTVDLWDLKFGRPMKKRGGMGALGVEISPDSSLLVGFGGPMVRVWSIDKEEQPMEIQLSDNNVTCVCFAQDGERLLIGDEQGALSLVDLRHKENLWTSHIHNGPITSLWVTDDGKKALTGGADESIRILELADGDELARLVGHRSAVTSIKSIPGSEYMVSVSLDSTIKIWDSRTSRCFRTLDDSDEPFTCCDVSPDGATLVTGGSKGSIQLWELETRWFEKDLLEPAISVPKTYVELSALHEEFTKATEDFYKAWGSFEHSKALSAFNRMTKAPGYCWSKEAIQVRTLLRNTFVYERLESASFIRSVRGHTDAVTQLHAARDCLTLITGGADGMAYAWDVVTGAKLFSMDLGGRALMVHAAGKIAVAFTLGEDMRLRSWDAKGRSKLIAEGIKPPISVAEDGKTAIAIDENETPVKIDLGTGRMETLGATLPSNIVLKDFSPTLEAVHSVRDRSRIQRWELATGRVQGSYRDLGVDITALAVIDSDKKLIAGTSAGDIQVYMVGAGINVNTIKAHNSALRTLSMGPTQDICVSGGDDCSAKIWNISDSQPLASLTGHAAPVTGLHFFRNGSIIASGDADGSVRLWGLTWGLSSPVPAKRTGDGP